MLDDFEFVWLIEGSATWQFQSDTASGPITAELVPGDLILARPGGTDQFRWDPRQSSRHGYVHFRLPETDDDEVSSWPFVRSLVPGSLGHELCRYLIRLSQVGGQPVLTLTSHALRVLLDLFVATGAGGEFPRELSAPVAAALAATREIWSRDGLRAIPLDELARAAGVSVGHLARCSFRDLGSGLVAALELVRLGEAAAQLQRSDRAVERVGRYAGFASPYHFSRRFARVYGLPPGRYRRTRQGDDPLGPLVDAGLLPLWAQLREAGGAPNSGLRVAGQPDPAEGGLHGAHPALQRAAD